MRTLRTKYLSNIPINEDNYKVDFIILEKYQSFSSEILRLSLLGLTIYGFLITNVIFKITDVDKKNFIFIKPFSGNKLLLLLGAVILILTALLALSHRYFSTDCMTHFIRGFRLRQKIFEIKSAQTDNKKVLNKLKKTLKNEKLSFEKDLNLCKWLLITSCLFLIAGILIITIALASSFKDLLI
ncbi:hypothetical protein [Flavobacterium tructae]|uniref:Uncharacterized protein n=1 Tax=Flavobacterium tructae TaxID=1114873 RepID=A0A1S1J2I2_9FLAO|nr:hypothetical protein [Flavobacterium tructae]OHT43970.1 hypothetical protein BHE19_16675 [Flavobacterium tructae]OXB21516.1 hypothetical protein B0A71_03145 [Flavobacterium tructae]